MQRAVFGTPGRTRCPLCRQALERERTIVASARSLATSPLAGDRR